MHKYKKLQSIGYGSNGNNVILVKNIENGEVSIFYLLIKIKYRYMQWKEYLWMKMMKIQIEKILMK